jgi:hypothetical protein
MFIKNKIGCTICWKSFLSLQEIGTHSSVPIYSSVPMNIIQIKFVGTKTDEYMGLMDEYRARTVWLRFATYICWWCHVTDEYRRPPASLSFFLRARPCHHNSFSSLPFALAHTTGRHLHPPLPSARCRHHLPPTPLHASPPGKVFFIFYF